jgi:hypothetical protein
MARSRAEQARHREVGTRNQARDAARTREGFFIENPPAAGETVRLVVAIHTLGSNANNTFDRVPQQTQESK